MVIDRLKSLRNEKRLSQKDFAKALRVSQQTVASWENGRTEPSHAALTDIADYFNVSADYLLGRENSKTPVLSDDETTVLGVFDTLSAEGKKLLMAILSSLCVTHSRNKPKLSNVVQQNRGGNNYGVVGGNFNSNVTIG